MRRRVRRLITEPVTDVKFEDEWPPISRPLEFVQDRRPRDHAVARRQVVVGHSEIVVDVARAQERPRLAHRARHVAVVPDLRVTEIETDTEPGMSQGANILDDASEAVGVLGSVLQREDASMLGGVVGEPREGVARGQMRHLFQA